MTEKQSLHILHLVLSLQVGGAERVVCNLVTGQPAQGWIQSVCCLDDVGSLGGQLAAAGYPVHVLQRQSGVDWKLIGRLRSLCRKNKVDIIHAHGESPWFYGALAARLVPWCEIPTITTIHGYGGGDRRKMQGYRLWKFLGSLTRKIVLVTSVFQKELEHAGMSSSKMTTIVNGVDIAHKAVTDWEIDELKKQHGIGDEYVIGIVARLSSIKNHPLLLQAVARLRTDPRRPVRMLIVGDGPERLSLENLAAELGVREKVVFCGEQENVALYYSLFDVFVLPSFSEGISMTILEAMAAGVPVIASAVGGNEEIISHNRNGLLFSSNDLDGLVKMLHRLMWNPEFAKDLGSQGRQTVQTTFSMETMLRSYRQVYRAVLA